MKAIKATLIALVLLATVFTAFGCKSSSSTSTTATVRNATVIKGTLTNSITATGNLAYSNTDDLAFEVDSGYVDQILVEEGDSVTKGEQLATVNTGGTSVSTSGTTGWDTYIQNLETTLYNAQTTLINDKLTLADEENTLISAQSTVGDKELALQKAQITLESSEYALSQIDAVKDAQDAIDAAQLALDVAKANGEKTSDLSDDLVKAQAKLTSVLAIAKANSSAVSLTATTTTTTDANGKKVTLSSLSTSAALAIAEAQQTVDEAQKAVDDAEQAIATAQTAVNKAQQELELTKLDIIQDQKDIDNAQTNVDDAKSKSTVIVAPYDGYITSVVLSGGDEIKKGSVAMTIADPTQFEADVLVTENDISNVILDGEATVSLDALSDVSFPAKVTWIAPTATVSSGVVNYDVTVELTSLTPISTGTTTVDNTTYTLKEGLSATVDIIIEQKADVLYLPSKAITTQGPNSTVQVISGNTTETRTVTTGMTDGTNTEILTGVTEGEKVTYTATTSSSSSSSSSGMPGMGMGGPGF